MYARKEVILSGGAIGSLHSDAVGHRSRAHRRGALYFVGSLLLLVLAVFVCCISSPIAANRKMLFMIGIPVVTDLPVGENLQDHLFVPFMFDSPSIKTFKEKDLSIRALYQARYLSLNLFISF